MKSIPSTLTALLTITAIAVLLGVGVPATAEAQQCTFDTRTFLPSGGQVIESVTAYNRYYNWTIDANGNTTAWSDNGNCLDGVTRYIQGPCAGHGSCNCTFGSRTFEPDVRNENGGNLIESITAYGKICRFRQGVPNNQSCESMLTFDGDRYAAATGPCFGKSTCNFSARSIKEDGGQWFEYIIASDTTGQMNRWRYIWDDISNQWVFLSAQNLFGVENPDYSRDNTSEPLGPCDYDIPPPFGTCQINSLAHMSAFGVTPAHEAVTAHNRFWNWDFPSHQPWSSNNDFLASVDRYKAGNAGPCPY